MSLLARSASAFLGILLCLAAGRAQTLSRPAPPTGRITLNVVVTPKSGAPVTGLHQQDFTVLDNGVPQPIATFQAVAASPSSPLEVVLLIDAVNTTTQNIAIERKEIDNFLQADAGRLAYPTTLAIFTDTGMELQQDFSTDGIVLAAELDHQTIGLRTLRPDSQWAAQERVQLSLDALNVLVRKEALRPGRKIILWVSPGWPLISSAMVTLQDKQMQLFYSQIADTSTLLRGAGITLYSIDPLGPGEDVQRTNLYQSFVKGVAKPSQVEIGDLGLQVLAVQTGGLALGPSNDITALLRRAIADTTAYYELSFDAPPSERPNEYHALQIKVSQPGLTARTRTGYYGHP